MKRMAYLGTFHGSAVPANESATVFQAEARSSTILPVQDAELPTELQGGAGFESTVEVREDGTFGEYGSIDFGGNNTIRFRELAPGHMAPAGDGRNAGAVDWVVEAGTGIFDGAAGYITSNFSLGESGDLVDYQVVSLLLP